MGCVDITYFSLLMFTYENIEYSVKTHILVYYIVSIIDARVM